MVVYPVTIVMDRYDGAYSGARWTAWNLYEPPHGCLDGDVECAEFWGGLDIPVGKGQSPAEAYENLVEALGER